MTQHRLLLLVSAIARNPGIAPSETGQNPMLVLLAEMRAIAIANNLEWQDWSEHTIRKDLIVLRRYGILPRKHQRSGYRIDAAEPLPPPVRAPRKRVKCSISDEELLKLRDEGRSLAEVAKVAGLKSREAVRLREKKARQLKGL